MPPVFYIERDLFKISSDWVSNKSDSINKPQSDFFEASGLPSGAMMVTNGSVKPWGGALVSRKRPVPSSNGKLLNWLAYRLKFKFPSSTAANTARLETDLKICVRTRPSANVPIRNVANFSTQINSDTLQVQIDQDPPGWVNSGFILDPIMPDVWHTMEFRFFFDDQAQTFSILSIQFDNRLYAIPESLQGVPMSLTNWEQVSSLQLQTEVYAAKSTVLVEYDEGVLCWSDQRITEIPQVPATLMEASFWWPRERRDDEELLGGTFDIFGPGATSLERHAN